MKQLVSIFFSLKNMKDVQRLNEKLTVSSWLVKYYKMNSQF
jgi:hypothetical protein